MTRKCYREDGERGGPFNIPECSGEVKYHIRGYFTLPRAWGDQDLWLCEAHARFQQAANPFGGRVEEVR